MMPKLLGEEVASTPAVTICINHLPDPEKGNSSLKSIRNFIVTYQKKVKHVDRGRILRLRGKLHVTKVGVAQAKL